MINRQCIAACLHDLQARVNATKRVQAETAVNLDRILPSILGNVFDGKL